MDYFDLDGIKNYKVAIDNRVIYQTNSYEYLFFIETREKLRHLILLLSERLNQTLIITYSEIPNKRGGRGMPIYYRDYIIVGFEREGMNLNKNVFIKCCFYFWDNHPMFYTQIDVNFKDENNPYNQYKEELNNISPFYVEVNDDFPKNWGDLLELLTPRILDLINGLEDFLDNKRITIHENNNIVSMDNKYHLNQILYGSPGTGKTYDTKELAVNIILGKENRSRKEILRLYNELQEKELIYFTTFHQSLSYEDFIEGIKPESSNGNIIYEVKDGILKQIVNKALSNYENAKAGNSDKIPFEEAFEKLKNEWEENPDLKFPLTLKGYDYTIIGFTNSSIQFKKASGGIGHTLSINTLRELYYGKVYNFKQGVGIYYPSILNKLNEYKQEVKEVKKNKNFVLIIDEINRGNISSIFGELITLIEEDKRKGNDEEIEIILPYSNEKFSIPNNIYIIGTMNTADRSVEALDTALRRRFSFTEMKSKPELLQSHFMLYNQLWKYIGFDWHDEKWINVEKDFKELFGLSKEWDTDDGKFWNTFMKEGYNLYGHSEQLKKYILDNFNLSQMLDAINKRIELLINKDHQIGHSYFINIESLEDLKVTFKNKVIPLLEEYFFGDFGKIGLVLGNEFIQKVDDKQKVEFANFDHEDNQTLREKPIYIFTNSEDWTLDSFKSIYS
ncbi:MAG: AAA family ATPase [Chitinophagales bacterium]